MRIGILGSGNVGQHLALGFIKLGNEVKIGTRDTDKLKDFADKNPKIKLGNFEEAAHFGEIIVIATSWAGTENAINLAKKSNFHNKIVIDVTNALDFSHGMPPKLDSSPGNSAGERIQKWLPESKIVKAFNIVNAQLMCAPKIDKNEPDLFIAGNDDEAKKLVASFAHQWGWRNVHDLGKIEQAYLLEALAMIIVNFGFKDNNWMRAFKLLS